MERSGDRYGNVRHRGSKSPTIEEIQVQKIHTPTRNISRLAISAIVIGVLFGVLILYNLYAKQWTRFDSHQHKESPHQQQSTDELTTPEQFKPETQLQEGARFFVGFHKTAENLLYIVDQVIRDRNNMTAVIRELIEEGPPIVTVTRSRLVIPKLLPKEVNTSHWQIDHTYMHSDYIRILLSAASALGALDASKALVQVLTVGLGGGSVNVFLRHAHQNVNVTAVEIDPAMVEVAKKYFGFVEDDRQYCVVDDGIHFISECAHKGDKFDVILLDASKTVVGFAECPVKPFTEAEVIRQIAEILSEQGVLLINQLSVGAEAAPYDTVQKKFEKFFSGCVRFDVPAKVNKALICVKEFTHYKYMQSDHFNNDMQKYLIEL